MTELPEDAELVSMKDSILKLEPDDILVVRVPGAISNQSAEGIKNRFESRYGIKCMVLSEGMELQVLRRQQAH